MYDLSDLCSKEFKQEFFFKRVSSTIHLYLNFSSIHMTVYVHLCSWCRYFTAIKSLQLFHLLVHKTYIQVHHWFILHLYVLKIILNSWNSRLPTKSIDQLFWILIMYLYVKNGSVFSTEDREFIIYYICTLCRDASG